MTKLLTPETLLHEYQQWSIIDVRSPAEFAKGHIPQAVNIPLFTDEERAQVGTTYKRKGRQKAIWLGLDIVGPKMRNLAEEMSKVTKKKPLLIHCWRGGMRSEFMHWLASRVDLDAHLLQGGYKGFRNCILAQMNQIKPIAILGGKTGSGKTERLQDLEQAGESIIDLEGLANHRGSAFGGIGKGDQPAQQTFENHLGIQWAALSSEQVIWIENESRLIGRVSIPQPFWEQMKGAHLYCLDVPMTARLTRLVREYGIHSIEELEHAISRIQKKMSPEALQKTLDALHNENFSDCFQVLLEKYYDKFYAYGLEKRQAEHVSHIPYSDDNEKQISYLIKASQMIQATPIDSVQQPNLSL